MRLAGWFLERAERLRYWRTLPLPALIWAALTAFLSFASLGFADDLASALRLPFWCVLAESTLLSAMAAGCLVSTIRRPKVLFAIVPVSILVALMLTWIESGLPLNNALVGSRFKDVRERLVMDGLLSSTTGLLGYFVLLGFVGTQGVRHVRVRTELEMAEQLQQTLAPPLVALKGGYEVYGKSAPSSQMGGDLLDAIDDGTGMVCYVGDVAGHGIQAGVFMGMVKTAARTALLRPGSLEELLADLNRVLFEVKAGSTTYATLACVRCRDGHRVEYALAGNGPILHYRGSSKTTSRLAMEQFPLGLFANAKFQSGLVEIQPGDILALMTDGLPEVEDANGEQFGLDQLGEIVARNGEAPLAALAESLFAATRRHGTQVDDETVVLVRAT
jgi:hypothetical protein